MAPAYDVPPEFPLCSFAGKFFFVICPSCRQNIFDGLCVSCQKKLDKPDQESDYYILGVAQKLAEEIIRFRSEFNKWIPKIQKLQQTTTIPQGKNVTSLFKKKRK